MLYRPRCRLASSRVWFSTLTRGAVLCHVLRTLLNCHVSVFDLAKGTRTRRHPINPPSLLSCLSCLPSYDTQFSVASKIPRSAFSVASMSFATISSSSVRRSRAFESSMKRNAFPESKYTRLSSGASPSSVLSK